MIVVVVRELSQLYVGVPTSSEVPDTCTQHVLKRLNRPPALPIRLWVIRNAEMQARAQLLMKFLPKRGSEMHVSI